MTKLQFLVLYRQFLFRMVDIELLSAQGEMSKLLGQFVALLVFLSLVFSIPVLSFGGYKPTPTQIMFNRSAEHFLIATTMLVVGLFAVLSWDSTFPDRRDVLILAPLPIRASTLFLAKGAAVATALSITVVALNVVTGLLWPLALGGTGVLSTIRLYGVYWITMFASGAFMFCCVLGVQGLAAQLLSRRRFLSLSSFMQLTAFCLFVSVYFLQPMLATPAVLTAAQNSGRLAWLPSYWFLGLFQQLNGSPALAPLARRAWMGLAVAGCGTATAYVLSYFRTLRKIVEEPDIVPSTSGGSWLPRFGNRFQTAVVQFSIRTLLRSRQHRIILAFYAGMGFAVTIFFQKANVAQAQFWAGSGGDPWHQVNVPLLASSILMMGFVVVGTRVACSMPLDLRANWIFRITPVRGGMECLAARRRSLHVLAVTPVWVVSAVFFLSVWSWRPAAGHLVALGLLGMILAELCLYGTQKIPFTCSYLPGKSHIQMTFLLCIGMIVLLVDSGAEFERRALDHSANLVILLGVLVFALVCAKWWMRALALSEGVDLEFEEEPNPAVLVLGLNRD